ncbi:MAG: hypothetical protein KTR24_14000 [Saprospiraceae bacterium]|nr:hypothetical protein [Saprospiraceae bacterium]
MKNSFRYIFLPAFVLLLVGTSLAQEELTVINFDVHLHKDLIETLDPRPLSGSREIAKATKAEKYFKAITQDTLWTMLTSALNGVEIATLPKDALLNYTKTLYSGDSDYPTALIAKSSIKNARKNGYEGQQFIGVNLRIEMAIELASLGKLGGQVKPNIELVLTTFDADGKKTNKASEKIKSDQKIKRKDFLNKFDRTEPVHMEELLMKLLQDIPSLVDATVQKLAKNI